MCYYAPMPLMFEWGEGEAVTEVLPKLASGEDIQQSAENLLPHMQQTFLYYDPTVLLKVCEEVCCEVVEVVVGELAREVVTALVDEMVKSYLGHARLLSASSLERPQPKLEDARPSTNPTQVVASRGIGRQSSRITVTKYGHKERKEPLQPLTPQLRKRRGAGYSGVEKLPVLEHRSKHFTREVAEHICLVVLDELLFQQFLEIAIVGARGVHKTAAEALADGILNELLFEGFLKQIYEKQVSSKHPLPCTHVLNQL